MGTNINIYLNLLISGAESSSVSFNSTRSRSINFFLVIMIDYWFFLFTRAKMICQSTHWTDQYSEKTHWRSKNENCKFTQGVKISLKNFKQQQIPGSSVQTTVHEYKLFRDVITSTKIWRKTQTVTHRWEETVQVQPPRLKPNMNLKQTNN